MSEELIEQVAGDTVSNVLPVESLTIAECALVTDQLKQLLKVHPSVCLNMKMCEDIDSSGIQLLTILQVDQETANRVHWRDLHDNVTSLAERLGLSQWVQAGLALV